MGKGNIIFLNGTSSSGKTTIAKNLQEVFNEPYYLLSIDSFFEMMPEKHINNLKNNAPSNVIDNLLLNMHHYIAWFSTNGCNVIVDHVLSYQSWLFKYFNLLMGLPVVLVGVHCTLDELEKRERDRGDREIGLAKRQFDSVHVHGFYDIDVDTNINNPKECAIQISEHINTQSPYAFNRLLNELSIN